VIGASNDATVRTRGAVDMEPVAHRAANQLTVIAREIARTPQHDPALARLGEDVLAAIAPVEEITNAPFGPASMYYTHDLPEGVRLARDVATGLQLATTPDGADIRTEPILADLGVAVDLLR
jgi:hypothetical protein